jgi:hypothetical protein
MRSAFSNSHRQIMQRRRRGLGYPVLPDQFVTAAGVSESFSPQTPDPTVVSILQSQGQQLPADLAAKWAAAQAGPPSPSSSPANPANGALTPSGQPISTQTGQSVTLMTTIGIAPGVWQCVMSDGSSHYCDVAGQPISYSPPAVTPATTPAAGSQPTSVVSPSVTPTPSPTPQPITVVAVTPAGGQISTTSGTPAAVTTAAGQSSFIDSALAWLQTPSFLGFVPNWALVAAGAALLFMSEDSGSHRRR